MHRILFTKIFPVAVQCAFGAGGKTVLEPTKTATRHHPCKNSKFVLFFLTSYAAELLNANNTVQFVLRSKQGWYAIPKICSMSIENGIVGTVVFQAMNHLGVSIILGRNKEIPA